MIAGIKKLFLLLLIFGAVFGIWKFVTRDKSVHYLFTTAAVMRGDITSKVTATGELSAVNVVEVGTQVSGRIEEIYVDFNSEVKAGQLIALIDPSVAKLELRGAESNLAVSLASVKSARANFKDAQKKLNRNRELLRKNFIAPSEVDTSEADVEMKQAALEEALSRVVQVRIAPETQDNVVTYTVIINVDNQDQKLMPGMTANVLIETEHHDDVLRLPTASLRFTPSEELLSTISFDTALLEEQKSINEATVWVERNGKLDRAVDIVTGISDNRWTHLVKGNLSEGEHLI